MAAEFWIPAFGMLALVAAAFLRAYAAQPPQDDGKGADQRIYKDQLAEVERDIAKGNLSPEEGARLRAEVARRLLEADRAEGAVSQIVAGTARWPLAVILVLLAGGAALYAFWLGAPGYPDLPLSDRMARAEENYNARPSQDAAEAQIGPQGAMPADPAEAELLIRLREAVAARPDDLQGHELLARTEASIGNLAGARAAFERVLAIKGESATAANHAQLAEVMIGAAGGLVTPQAEEQLINALQLDPTNGAARFYSGLMMAQVGRPDQAFALWRALLEDSTSQDPWYATIRSQIEGLAQAAGVPYTAPAEGQAPGPTSDDIAAAAQMTEEDRQEMIRGMVSGLEERLLTEGGPAEDWARLVTSLAVLGESQRAQAAIDAGRSALGDDPEALKMLNDAASGIAP